MQSSKMVLSEKFPQEFRRIPIGFDEATRTEVFGRYDQETLDEALSRDAYNQLTEEVRSRHFEFLSYPLGLFLAKLKLKDRDPFYLQFLNPYGDLEYTTFRIADPRFLKAKGVYAYVHGDELLYIGGCINSMEQQIDQGCGSISSRKCLIPGQPASCLLNAKITEHRSRLSLWIHMIEDDGAIAELTKALVAELSPPWNA